MNISLNSSDVQTSGRIAAIVLLLIALAAIIFLPGAHWGEGIGPAPSFTGKVMSITPATSQEKAQDSTRLGTVLIQGANNYQLLLRVKHATGNGCLGNSALHLFDITIGEIVTTRYWLDKPDTASNPHKGSAVYINERC